MRSQFWERMVLSDLWRITVEGVKMTFREIAGGLYAVGVDASGKVSYITNSSYDANNKMLRFSTNHFSIYGIGYKALIDFTNIATPLRNN